MALEKKSNLRKMELVFTEGEINPRCHCEHDIIILEDGVEIARTQERKKMDISEAKTLVAEAKVMKEVEAKELPVQPI